MTKTIEIGDILQVSDKARMVYLGDGFARGELIHTNGQWLVPAGQPDKAPLTEKQIAFWISKK